MSVSLTFDADRRVAHLVLDRPAKLNALSVTLLRDLVAACAELQREPDLRVVVVRGAGERAFSAGFDLADFADPEGADLGRAATDALDSLRAVTIAAIRGHCIGGGVVLASACDLRIAATDARFAIPEIDLGIPLAWGGLPRLVRELGPALTKELVLTCRPFGAAEALGWRWLNAVVDPVDVFDHADALAASIATKPRFGTLSTVQQTRIASEQLVPTHHADVERVLLDLAAADAESRGAAAAYRARRTR